MFSNTLSTGALAVLLAGSHLAAAHIEIQYPPPFRSRFNTNAVNIDYTNTAPLADTGANYPCKGYHSDLGTAAGKSVATFAPGGTYNFTTAGTASHGGGSCQVSLSYDKGKTFTVIQSIIGGCPLSSSYPFTVPADAPTGEAIWAWTWNNQIGNREQYMNCAAVTIGSGAGKRDEAAEAAQVEAPAKRATAAFSARPQIFLANIGNGCATTEGTDVNYPNPGPDVTTSGSKIGPPVGSCGSGAGAGAGAGNGSGSGSGSGSTPTSSQAAAPATTSKVNLPGGVFVTVPPTTTTAAPAAQTTLKTSTKAAAASPAPTPSSGSGSSGSGSGSGSTGSAGAHAAGTACTSEGAWNCIAGKQWQRCASGLWSAVQPVAPGTVCKAGEGATLDVSAAKVRRRFRGAGKFALF